MCEIENYDSINGSMVLRCPVVTMMDDHIYTEWLPMHKSTVYCGKKDFLEAPMEANLNLYVYYRPFGIMPETHEVFAFLMKRDKDGNAEWLPQGQEFPMPAHREAHSVLLAPY